MPTVMPAIRGETGEIELGKPRGSGIPSSNDEDWSPISGSRNAKWWYSTFHNVTAMVGAGVLGLPAAMAYLGWGFGITVLVLSWVITLYTLYQMVEMHEMVPGRRFDRYHELGQYAFKQFGPKVGLYMMVPQQLIVEVGVNIIYMVTGGECLKKFHDLIKCPESATNHTLKCGAIGKSAWIIIFASQHFFLGQLPNFDSIAGVSLAAAIMSLCYSIIAWGAPLANGSPLVPDYGMPKKSTAGLIFGVFNALGTVAFAYAGHNVVLEIQATIPSTPEKPSKIAMWRGVVVAYGVVAFCYFPVAIVGFYTYGNAVSDNILLQLGEPRWLIAAANMMVVVHVTGSYQLYAMPVFDMIEILVFKIMKFKPRRLTRIVLRSIYIAFTVFVACSIPFFGALMGFFGGLVFAPTTYFLPCIMWLFIFKPKTFGISWITNWICIVLGVLIMFTSATGGLRNIITNAATYKFYQ